MPDLREQQLFNLDVLSFIKWSYPQATFTNKWQKHNFVNFNFLYLPSATIASCNGGSAIQFPAESFICLLSDAKCRRNIGACTTRKNLPNLVHVVAVSLLLHARYWQHCLKPEEKHFSYFFREVSKGALFISWDHHYRIDHK